MSAIQRGLGHSLVCQLEEMRYIPYMYNIRQNVGSERETDISSLMAQGNKSFFQTLEIESPFGKKVHLVCVILISCCCFCSGGGTDQESTV